MVDFNDTTKQAQQDLKDKFEEGKNKIIDGLDEVKEKGKDLAEKAKEKLTPETIIQIKEIVKQVKELISNLPLEQLPGGVDKWIEKLDKLFEKLDPPDPASTEAHIRALRSLIDEELVPFIDHNVALAEQDLDIYLRRVSLTYDLLIILDVEMDRLA